MYDWVTLLCNINWHNIVNQLHFNVKKKLLLQCLSDPVMIRTRGYREESRLYWGGANSIGCAGLRERGESTVTPRFLAEVGGWRLGLFTKMT